MVKLDEMSLVVFEWKTPFKENDDAAARSICWCYTVIFCLNLPRHPPKPAISSVALIIQSHFPNLVKSEAPKLGIHGFYPWWFPKSWDP